MFRVSLRILNMFKRVEPQPPSTSTCKRRKKEVTLEDSIITGYKHRLLPPPLSDHSLVRIRKTLSIRNDVKRHLDTTVDGYTRSHRQDGVLRDFA